MSSLVAGGEIEILDAVSGVASASAVRPRDYPYVNV